MGGASPCLTGPNTLPWNFLYQGWRKYQGLLGSLEGMGDRGWVGV